METNLVSCAVDCGSLNRSGDSEGEEASDRKNWGERKRERALVLVSKMSMGILDMCLQLLRS